MALNEVAIPTNRSLQIGGAAADARRRRIGSIRGSISGATLWNAPAMPRTVPRVSSIETVNHIAERLDDWHLLALYDCAIAAMKRQHRLDTARRRARAN